MNTENNRRSFLKRLFGAAVLAVTPVSLFGASEYQNLPEEQRAFLIDFEHWVNEYIPVAEKQKENPNDLENNRRIVQLADLAGKRSEKLAKYMQSNEFKNAYLEISNRLSERINSFA